MLKERAELLAQIRHFFEQKNVLEVETPLLGQTGVCDPHLHNLSTTVNDQKYYLQTSPEFAMKRLLAAGSGSIYQICKAFRDDEKSRLHNPEFTMVEWYREGFDYIQLMDEVEELILKVTEIKGIMRITYRDAFLQTTEIDPFITTVEDLSKTAGNVSGIMTKNDLLDLILIDQVIPKLDKAVFLYDFPEDQAAMAKVRGNISERFELIINGIELA
ncbi:MAG: amino acid--tRNA ligase-related protein, partial [Gammaproteobacteria bacterium]